MSGRGKAIGGRDGKVRVRLGKGKERPEQVFKRQINKYVRKYIHTNTHVHAHAHTRAPTEFLIATTAINSTKMENTLCASTNICRRRRVRTSACLNHHMNTNLNALASQGKKRQ